MALHGISGTVAFSDNIFIGGMTLEELFQRTQQVLLRLRKHKLTVRAEKCQFPMTEMECLGFRINETGVQPSVKKGGSHTKRTATTK